MNEEFLNIFRKEMEEIAENVVKKYIKQNNYEKPYDGTVTAVNTDSNGNVTHCTVNLGFTVLENLKNITGEMLEEGSGVTVYARGGNINNSYVGLKLY